MNENGLNKSAKIGIVITVLVIGFLIYSGINSGNNQSKTTEKAATTSVTLETASHSYSGVPYEGMAESEVEFTSLGNADEVEACTDFYKLNAKHRWKEYKWKENGKTVFKVTIRYFDYEKDCAVPGFVSDVCDWRDSYKSNKTTTKKHTTTTDPYNAKDYNNEDDFYDDHYDDFADYNEAEEYYNDHND